MATATPEFQDEVRHKTAGTIGTVIAVYEEDGVIFFDVRTTEDRIRWHTPSTNWEVLKKYDKRNE